jgi:hypothetical protein
MVGSEAKTHLWHSDERKVDLNPEGPRVAKRGDSEDALSSSLNWSERGRAAEDDASMLFLNCSKQILDAEIHRRKVDKRIFVFPPFPVTSEFHCSRRPIDLRHFA